MDTATLAARTPDLVEAVRAGITGNRVTFAGRSLIALRWDRGEKNRALRVSFPGDYDDTPPSPEYVAYLTASDGEGEGFTIWLTRDLLTPHHCGGWMRGLGAL